MAHLPIYSDSTIIRPMLMTNVILKCFQMLHISMAYEINLKYLLCSALLIMPSPHSRHHRAYFPTNRRRSKLYPPSLWSTPTQPLERYWRIEMFTQTTINRRRGIVVPMIQGGTQGKEAPPMCISMILLFGPNFQPSEIWRLSENLSGVSE